jgi:hypothetical protein
VSVSKHFLFPFRELQIEHFAIQASSMSIYHSHTLRFVSREANRTYAKDGLMMPGVKAKNAVALPV